MSFMLINGYYGLYTPIYSRCHFVESNMFSDKSIFSWNEKPKQSMFLIVNLVTKQEIDKTR